MSVYFGIMLLVFLTLLTDKSVSIRAIAWILIVMCGIGIYRAQRCGYVAIYPTRLVVRTLLRTRVFNLKDIQSVDARAVMQVTSRVIPVLTFKNGTHYMISEFFMQKRTFERTSGGNKITNLVTAIARSLNNI
jgi:hypothetical protein